MTTEARISSPPTAWTAEKLSPNRITARITVTTGSHVLRSDARAAPTRGRPARKVEIHRARSDRLDPAHDRLAQQDVAGVDDRRGNRKHKTPRDVQLRAADEEDQTGEAAHERERVQSRDRPAEKQPPGDDDEARIDVDDQHAKRRRQRLQGGEVGQRLAGVDDRAEAEEREQAPALEAERVLPQDQRQPPHADRREHESEREQLRGAETFAVCELGEDRVGAERRGGDQHEGHARPLCPAARGRAGRF